MAERTLVLHSTGPIIGFEDLGVLLLCRQLTYSKIFLLWLFPGLKGGVSGLTAENGEENLMDARGGFLTCTKDKMLNTPNPEAWKIEPWNRFNESFCFDSLLKKKHQHILMVFF